MSSDFEVTSPSASTPKPVIVTVPMVKSPDPSTFVAPVKAPEANVAVPSVKEPPVTAPLAVTVEPSNVPLSILTLVNDCVFMSIGLSNITNWEYKESVSIRRESVRCTRVSNLRSSLTMFNEVNALLPMILLSTTDESRVA